VCFREVTPLSDNGPVIAACIPAYNEERSIGGVVVRAMKHVDRVVVCDDGSVDLTGAIAAGLGASVVRHDRNMGYGASLRSLFDEALRLGVDVMVTLDADGQHDPEEIPRLIDRLAAGDVDIVIGSRFLDGGGSDVSSVRKVGIKFITELASNGGPQVTDAQSGFRAYSRKALRSLILTEQGMGASTEILLKAKKAGLRIAEVPINVTYGGRDMDAAGLIQGLDVVGSIIKHQSIRHPMRFYGLLAALFFSVGLAFGLWALDLYRVEGRLVTNIALISISSSIIGLIFFMTGVILYTLVSVLRERA